MVQLGMNSSNTATAEAAARMLLQLPGLTAAEVVELLHTAVARHAVNSALRHLCAATIKGWNPWQLSAEHALAVLQQAVALGAAQDSDAADAMFRELASSMTHGSFQRRTASDQQHLG
jgi:hypothetical protein